MSAFALVVLAAGCARESAEQYMQEAESQMRAGNVLRALGAQERASQRDPNAVRPYLLRAELLTRIGRYREAREAALTAHRLAPNDLEVTLALLQRTPDSFPPAEVEALARQAVKLAPQSAATHFLLGMAIVNANDPRRYPEALQAFQESNRLDDRAARTWIETGKLYRLMGDNEKAESSLKRATHLLDQEGGRMSLREMEDWLKQRRAAAFWLAQVYRRMGRMGDSRTAYAEVARWGEQARELKTLRDRASADPPDMMARARLQAIAQYGLDFWRRSPK